jgi:putative chitinase
MFDLDHDRFFADFPTRTGLQLTPARRTALDGLLTQLAQDPGFTMLEELAYVLATIQWETGRTFVPCKEIRADATKNPKLWATQNKYWPSGFYGRGYVQITWQKNYQLAGQKLSGQTFTVNGTPRLVTANTFTTAPDLVLDPAIAYAILSHGMRDGWFTGKKLSDYLKPGATPDYVNARRIVNGTDRAADIAAIATSMEQLLRASQLVVTP